MRWILVVVRWMRERPVVTDSLSATALAAGWWSVVTSVAASRPEPWYPAAWVGLWSVVGAVPVALRRRWPWPAVGLLVALCLAAFARVEIWQTAGISVLVVVYTTASRMPLRPAVVAVALLLVPTALAPVAVNSGTGLAAGLAIAALLTLVAFFVGRFAFTRHAYLAALEARAADAEANQRVLTDRAVAEERRHIARELHDVVAHQVSAMGVLATGARRALRTNPDAAGEALESIEHTGRTTLRELRRLLSVLRADGEDSGDALVPAPGLAAVRGLIDQIRSVTGLPVQVSVTGEPYPVDAGTGLTVYRLIQEALTNIVKHAGPAEVQVRLGFSAAALTVEVFDTGRGPSGEPTGGHGLLGMRERVALYGGELHTGPRPGGGFRVYATIPMDNLEGLSSPVAADIARGRAAGA